MEERSNEERIDVLGCLLLGGRFLGCMVFLFVAQFIIMVIVAILSLIFF